MLEAMKQMLLKGGVQVHETSGYAPPEDSLDKLDEWQQVLHGMHGLDGEPRDGATGRDVSSLMVTSDTVAREARTSKHGVNKWCKFGINCKLQDTGCRFDHVVPWRRSKQGSTRLIPCQQGADCTLAFCHFGHPPGHPLEFKTPPSTLCAPCNTSNKAEHSA
jgi:hypothetical protein